VFNRQKQAIIKASTEKALRVCLTVQHRVFNMDYCNLTGNAQNRQLKSGVFRYFTLLFVYN